ncbi:MAG: hypothetical protein HC897_13065 [Thermoanaerobaculia bacterium]|nr:hypothetical protein [Thermoanaerobaculia bacterium]
MSVEQLNQVHRRYVVLSNAFKSAWTFHQFMQGLQKVFAEQGPQAYTADFQGVYNRLKEVSGHLTEATAGAIATSLDGIEKDLDKLTAILLGADVQVSPGLLRQFFQRVKNYDDNILTQLVKFYLVSGGGDAWPFDRIDKADFLITKLCEEVRDGTDLLGLRDRTHLREVTIGFWSTLGSPALPEEEVSGVCETLEALRREVGSIESIDQLHEHDLVQRYRDLKHGLGSRFFEPRILQTVVETNLVVKNRIHELYRREEQRIVAEYQQIFELEREVPLDVQLSEELAEFRQAVERFEQQLQGSNLRLDELARLREKVRGLIPKLRPPSDHLDTPIVQPKEVREYLEESGVSRRGAPRTTSSLIISEDEEISEQQQLIIRTLDDTNPTLDPKRITLEREVFELGLEVREVVAYRRLFGGVTCDRELEDHILRAAALRLRIEQEVEQIKSILDDTAVTRDAPIFTQARRTTRLGDLFLRRFEHRLEQAVLGGDGAEAKALQMLKMRLMRAYSGLWLMVHRS